MNTESF